MPRPPWSSLEDHRRQLLQTQENSTRLAQAFGHFTTVGWGEWSMTRITRFDATFIEMPTMAYGMSLEDTSGNQDDDQDLVDTRYPRCFGGVYKWQTNAMGFFTGAWCFVIVETQSVLIDTFAAEPDYTIRHFFTFTGLATKDVPAHLLERIDGSAST